MTAKKTARPLTDDTDNSVRPWNMNSEVQIWADADGRPRTIEARSSKPSADVRRRSSAFAFVR